ncbi:sushi, von Willebrand factor type A, EGF and pentraxin domain-containing protein 1-like [Penaeus japonicus]|uniref:sushi, von Willebrand factor type A, EGF and pentraxin domain-containing protein 1-like n=1 Tax=Penaeus japonicus TaxID=27405 RepID=UPI001C70EC22|nr:sushi, von Willebrand factor type A, EGF and pentraxin domain-containing protein 1-like [Penaeus japonicus]
MYTNLQRIIYTCNRTGEVFGNRNSSISVTCQEDGNWTSVLPSSFSCKILCTGDPPQAPVNSSSDWDGLARAVDTEVVYTCNDSSQLFGNMNSSISVICQEDGNWISVLPSLFECRTPAPASASPPSLPEGANVVGNASQVYWIGSTITFECEKGMVTPQGTVNTTITMTEMGWSELDPDFKCYPVCAEDPPEPGDNADYDWDKTTRLFRTNVLYSLTC